MKIQYKNLNVGPTSANMKFETIGQQFSDRKYFIREKV